MHAGTCEEAAAARWLAAQPPNTILLVEVQYTPAVEYRKHQDWVQQRATTVASAIDCHLNKSGLYTQLDATGATIVLTAAEKGVGHDHAWNHTTACTTTEYVTCARRSTSTTICIKDTVDG